MTVITQWWWVRHAPVINPGKQIYGQRDVTADLSDAAPLAGVARLLPKGAVWVISHLSRCRDTANAICGGETTLDPLVESSLAEQDFGEWQGKTHADIGFHEDHQFWLAPAQFIPPGGESFAQMMIRVGVTIDRITAAYPGRDIVAVTHGGTIRAALGHALQLDPEKTLSFSIDTLSLTRLDHIARENGVAEWRIAAINIPPTAPS